jgi:LacI family transcriptional regulator
MKPARKIAFVSTFWSGKIQQVLRGGLRYADSHPPLLLRAFGRDREAVFRPELREALPALVAWEPDGVLAILESAGMERLLEAWPESPPPVVNCMSTRPFPGVTEVVGSMPDLVAKSVEHFRQLGLRQLGFLTFDETGVVTERLRSIVQGVVAVRATELDRMLLQATIPESVVAAYSAPVTPVPGQVADWLRGLPKPVGILAIELGGGGYVIRVCKALGLRVPEDVAVIGGCDDADACLANDPTLTSIGVPGDAIGFEAMNVLEGRMAGGLARTEPVRVQGAELQVRQSTGQRQAEICDLAAATGMTPGEAIRARQFEEAKRLLTGTELPMSLVAEMSGFASGNDFARAFRKREGMAPTAYRTLKRA